MHKFSLFFYLLIFIVSNSYSQCSPEEMINLRKTAIVFGEKDYKTGALRNTINDAKDIADSLRKLDFYVEYHTNDSLMQMREAMDNWFNKIKDYDVALFYFSGHGSQIGDINYLYPIDANPKSKFDLNTQTFPANEVVEKLSDSNLRCGIIILDACRNNPFAKSWNRDAANNGLSSMSGRGTFIGFAASPGETASDGNDKERNGIYTEAILKFITQPDLSLDEIFTRVNNYVRIKTKSNQVTFKSSSLNNNFCFNVSFKRADSSKRKNDAFIQYSSTLAFSPLQDEIYIADSSTDRILVKSLYSTNYQEFFQDSIRPLKIIKGKNFVYVLDSSKKSIFKIDAFRKNIVSKYQFLNTPIYFSISQNERKAYVIEGRIDGQIRLLSQNLISNDTSLVIKSNWRFNSILSSYDDSRLIISASKGDSSILFKLDVKTFKIIDSTKHNSLVHILGMTADGKEIFLTSNLNNSTNSRLLIMNTGSLNITDTVNVEANFLEVCKDSSYIFLGGTSSINVLRIRDRLITNTIFTSSTPAGIVTSNSYVAYIWLPKEQRVLVKDMKYNLEPIHVLSPDEKFQAFLKDQKSKYNTEEKRKAEKIFNTFSSSISRSLGLIRQELGPFYTETFDYSKEIEKIDYGNLTYITNRGIISQLNGKKLIPKFHIKIQSEKVILTITLEQDEPFIKEFSTTKNNYSGSYQEEFVKVIMDFIKNKIYILN